MRIMGTAGVSGAPVSTNPEPAGFRDFLSDAIEFWEPRRIVYNIVLALIVLGWVSFTWPHFRTALTRHSLLALFVLAAAANVCYCAAYLVDIPLQYSNFRNSWRRKRWGLWCVGILLAGAITYYWIADEIYPSLS